MTNKYNAIENPLLAEKYARDGLSNEQIAFKFGISVATLYNWQKKYIEFLEAIKRGKKPVDIEVENALLKRALGYEFEEKTTEIEVGIDGEPKVTKVKTVKKHISPDVGAIAFWLKNRNPDQWKEINRTDLNATLKEYAPTREERDAYLKSVQDEIKQQSE